MFGSLALALGLTALGDNSALAGRGDQRDHSRLTQAENLADLRVLDWTLWNVSKYYVESKRVAPAAMTLAGIEALEAAIPEVLVKPSTTGKVKIRVGKTEREFETDANALWAVGPQVREVFEFVNDHAELTKDEQREAEYAIVEGVLSTLDPHTNLLRPAAYEDMRTNTSGHFGGLGIEVGIRDTEITVIRVLPGNPAAKVGLQAGDRIVQIDDVSTVTMNLGEAVDLMRGPEGSEIILYVRREGLEKPKKFVIERAIIKLDSVTGEILPGKDAQGNDVNIGLVQISRNFAQTTGDELRVQLNEFENAGVSGIVLDMRDNPGGLLNAAVDVVDAFIDVGTIVSTVGESSPRDESKADSRYRFADVPLVVLVDQGSASATEIVAGALRNLDRAVIVGRRTFGKGSVQVLHDRRVSDTELALKLTVAQYLTPGDVSIQSVGVSPDLQTVPVYIGEEYLAYYGRKRFDLVREESLFSHLESSKIEAQAITAGPLYFLQQGSLGATGVAGRKDTKDKKPPKRAVLEEDADKRVELLLRDPEIRMARDLAIWAPSSKRSEILAKLPQFMEAQAQLEGARINESLASRNIDWAEGPAPAAGTSAVLQVELDTDKPNDTIRGGDHGVLTVRVTNKGDATAYQVRAISDSDYNYFDERELLFGKIAPGATKTSTLKLSVAAHELSRTDRIDFHVLSQHGAALAKDSRTSIDVSAEGIPRPAFAYGYQIIDNPDDAHAADAGDAGDEITGNGDGLLQVGERVHLRVWVQNSGPGDAQDARVQLRNGSGDAVFLHEGRGKIGELKVGAHDFVDLDLEVQKPTDEVKLQLTVNDNKIGEYVTEELVFPINKPLTFDETKQAALSNGQVDLYAAPTNEAPQIASIADGQRFASLGSAGGWHKLAIGKHQVAYAKTDDLELGGTAPRKPGTATMVYAVSPPKISLTGIASQVADETITISGVATDGEQIRDVYVTVYNPSRNLFGRAEKVFYQATQDPTTGRLEFSAEVPLTPGNNIIDVYARENEQVTGVERMWVLRTSGLAEARAKERSFATNGQLAVDTFNSPP